MVRNFKRDMGKIVSRGRPLDPQSWKEKQTDDVLARSCLEGNDVTRRATCVVKTLLAVCDKSTTEKISVELTQGRDK